MCLLFQDNIIGFGVAIALFETLVRLAVPGVISLTKASTFMYISDLVISMNIFGMFGDFGCVITVSHQSYGTFILSVRRSVVECHISLLHFTDKYFRYLMAITNVSVVIHILWMFLSADLLWELPWLVAMEQGCFRLCDWLSLRCLVPRINHLPLYDSPLFGKAIPN